MKIDEKLTFFFKDKSIDYYPNPTTHIFVILSVIWSHTNLKLLLLRAAVLHPIQKLSIIDFKCIIFIGNANEIFSFQLWHLIQKIQ